MDSLSCFFKQNSDEECRFIMQCKILLQILNSIRWEDGESGLEGNDIVAHIRSCPLCQRGVKGLSEALIDGPTLTCDQCRTRLPAYYEATRPEHPFVDLSDWEVAGVAKHLALCTSSCREEYEELMLLAELEERDEI